MDRNVSYKDLIEKLYKVNIHGGIKLGLSNILSLNQALGDPASHFKTIHVAGTNGKGSVSLKIAIALQAEGNRVGLFTSPHISTFRERVRLNGHLIEEEAICLLLPPIFDAIEKNNIPATFFEITTMLALLYFEVEKVDYAVLETGLGGRLDATNIVTPEVSIITSIGYDHKEILGDSLEAITLEKAGIIKKQVPVIIGPTVPIDIIKKVAEEKVSPLYAITDNFSFFNDENNAVAKRAMEELSLKKESIDKGLAAIPPCRFDIVRENPVVIMDVGHNPDGLTHLFTAIQNKFPNKKIRIIFGLSKTKDINVCLNILSKEASIFYVVEALNGKGESKIELKKKLLDLGIDEKVVFVEKDIEASVKKAMADVDVKNELILICGSFYIMSEARSALGIIEPKDVLDVN